jgi:tRNA pseudouridine55 synthase
LQPLYGVLQDKNKTYDFAAGEILLVDKPLNWTSFKVVNVLRYPLRKKYNKKRFKVGHAGTLDPLATGLLVVCTGKKTKAITGFIQDRKSYTGVIQLGATTPSFDLETEIDAKFETSHITQALIDEVKKQFEGPIEQTPPIYSAKKVDGKRAYDFARAGIAVEMKKASVTIHEIQLELKEDMQVSFFIECSKGTYIRSLANDIGQALNSGGHLIELRRTKSGDFDIKNAKSVDEWMEILNAVEVDLGEQEN